MKGRSWRRFSSFIPRIYPFQLSSPSLVSVKDSSVLLGLLVWLSHIQFGFTSTYALSFKVDFEIRMCYIVRMISSYVLSEGQWRCRPLFGYLVIAFILFRSGPDALFHFIQWYWLIDFVKLILSLFSFLFIGIIVNIKQTLFVKSINLKLMVTIYIHFFTSYFTNVLMIMAYCLYGVWLIFLGYMFSIFNFPRMR